jgi:5'-methylthioadenosine phosphorylase
VEAPRVTGDRLAVITGSGLAGQPIDTPEAAVDYQVLGRGDHLTVVTVHDCGSYLMVRRHGDHTAVPAHLVDHHANISALCEAGSSRVVALSSVGSLRTDWGVGTVVAPDDYLAFSAYATFWDDARGHHIPGFDAAFRAEVVAAWQAVTSTPIEDGGVYAQTSGPRFETPAEVRFLAQHADLVGMTVANESILASEAGLAYMALCKVDNMGNGLEGDPLTMDEYRAATEATRTQWLADLDALLERLTGGGPA